MLGADAFRRTISIIAIHFGGAERWRRYVGNMGQLAAPGDEAAMGTAGYMLDDYAGCLRCDMLTRPRVSSSPKLAQKDHGSILDVA